MCFTRNFSSLLTILICSGYGCLSQEMLSNSASTSIKPSIDSNAIHQWMRLGEDYDVSISNDGRYFAYIIDNKPVGSKTLIVQSLANSWKMEFPGASPIFFSADSRQYVFKKGDSLCLLPLGTNAPRCIATVSSVLQPDYYRIPTKQSKCEWLAWQLKDSTKQVVLCNMITGAKKYFDAVTDFRFNATGRLFAVKRQESDLSSLEVVYLPEQKTHKVWCAENRETTLESYVCDESGTQIACLLRDEKADQSGNSIWYYNIKMGKLIMKVSDGSTGIESDVLITGVVGFTENGRYITYSLQQRLVQPKDNSKAVGVDIWDYKDAVLYSAQPQQIQPETYLGVVGTGGLKAVRLTYSGEELRLLIHADFAVVGKSVGGDRFWDKSYRIDSNWLVSFKDGTRSLLKTTGTDFWFSPGGKYLVYYDAGQKNNYFSFNLNTGKVVNISGSLPENQLGYVDKYQLKKYTPVTNVGLAGWLKDDAGVLVYDNHDIWLLDLEMQNRPVNVTNGYGERHNVKFRLKDEELILETGSDLLLKAFNTKNKFNGFYRKKLSSKPDPLLLEMGSYIFDILGSNKIVALSNCNFYEGAGMEPRKALDAEVWIVKRQSANEAPNYFSTSDFKHYEQLTDLQPQKQYQWLTSELITFAQLDGIITQGVLYKPENFDSGKKYPVIFNFYDQMSHRLYQFPSPELMSTGFIDVAWFVSRDYLVFTPDLHFEKGKNGQSALNTVAGAVRYLSSLPFVDAKRIGLSGHSTAGGLTNYIITHTNNLFAAVLEGAGVSDVVSAALQLNGVEGGNRGSRLDVEMHRGESIWQNPGLWLSESPIMSADKITAPLLIFHCKKDGAVPWEQAVEMFVAMRRLNKKCWMLQYDDGDHVVGEKKDQIDLTTRITQFFDHYLNGAPPPRWMTQGIRATMKGIENGYNLDPAGSCALKGSNTCKVCEKWNEQYKRTPGMFTKPIEEWHLDKDLAH